MLHVLYESTVGNFDIFPYALHRSDTEFIHKIKCMCSKRFIDLSADLQLGLSFCAAKAIIVRLYLSLP